MLLIVMAITAAVVAVLAAAVLVLALEAAVSLHIVEHSNPLQCAWKCGGM